MSNIKWDNQYSDTSKYGNYCMEVNTNTTDPNYKNFLSKKCDNIKLNQKFRYVNNQIKTIDANNLLSTRCLTVSDPKTNNATAKWYVCDDPSIVQNQKFDIVNNKFKLQNTNKCLSVKDGFSNPENLIVSNDCNDLDKNQKFIIDTSGTLWLRGQLYKIGDEVIYNNTRYKCIQQHTSQASWAPDLTPSLWSRVLSTIPPTTTLPPTTTTLSPTSSTSVAFNNFFKINSPETDNSWTEIDSSKLTTTLAPTTPTTTISWDINILYKVNDIVIYKDKYYVCIQSHTSNSAWTPDVAITLWKLVPLTLEPMTTTTLLPTITTVEPTTTTVAPTTTTTLESKKYNSVWMCTPGNKKVTINWGHKKRDAIWACNNWIKECNNSQCVDAFLVVSETSTSIPFWDINEKYMKDDLVIFNRQIYRRLESELLRSQLITEESPDKSGFWTLHDPTAMPSTTVGPTTTVGPSTTFIPTTTTLAPKSVFSISWDINILYKVNDIVSYNDKYYVCIQSHTSNSAWTPDVAITLWKLQTTLAPTTTTLVPTTTTIPTTTVPMTTLTPTTTTLAPTTTLTPMTTLFPKTTSLAPATTSLAPTTTTLAPSTTTLQSTTTTTATSVPTTTTTSLPTTTTKSVPTTTTTLVPTTTTTRTTTTLVPTTILPNIVWVDGNIYKKNDIVFYNNKYYIGIKDNIVESPINSQNKNWVEVWDINIKYNYNDIVYYNGKFYKYNVKNTSIEEFSNSPDNDDSWEEIDINNLEINKILLIVLIVLTIIILLSGIYILFR